MVMAFNSVEETLHEALFAAGCVVGPEHSDGRRNIYRWSDGRLIATVDAEDVWQLVKAQRAKLLPAD